tara:strand:- start:173 stop:346 length:174 start_codon:yes stop_codon:yes gene_type:complete
MRNLRKADSKKFEHGRLGANLSVPFQGIFAKSSGAFYGKFTAFMIKNKSEKMTILLD